MNNNSQLSHRATRAADKRPILIVPYMWVGDFVRGHSVVTLLRERFPDRPVDVLATTLCAPLAGYMPGIRQTIVVDLPRGRIALSQQLALARRLRREGYGDALVMPRTWKSALAPFLAGIPRAHRIFRRRRAYFSSTIFASANGNCRAPSTAARRWRCRRTRRPPPAWPLPVLNVPASEIAAWQRKHGLAGNRPLVALAPGSVAPARRWPSASYAALSHRLLAEGCDVCVLGGPNEKPLAREIVGDTRARDLTGNDIARRRTGPGRFSGGGRQQFRATARRRSARHAVDRNLRSDDGSIVGAAQSARGRDRDQRRPAVPAMQSKCLPARPSPLPARHQPRRGARGRP